MEYWAEGTQSWFDTNRANDREHGPIDTREKLKVHDPDLAQLLTEVYGDFPWRYQRPERRTGEDRAHLAGLVVADFPRFRWPDSAPPLAQQGVELPWLSGAEVPSASPRQGGPATAVHVVNRRSGVVSVYWLDFEGKRRHYADLPPGQSHLQATYAGHVWMVTEQDHVIGAVVARATTGRVEIR
ncbi:MAG: hypothetical protein HZC55_09510 [Verrucomicrobia bacterium]|nr:hypothetical protein [Verrucomicrobiota bacterium]